jgi:polysaccharide biosynthesis/export protein
MERAAQRESLMQAPSMQQTSGCDPKTQGNCEANPPVTPPMAPAPGLPPNSPREIEGIPPQPLPDFSMTSPELRAGNNSSENFQTLLASTRGSSDGNGPGTPGGMNGISGGTAFGGGPGSGSRSPLTNIIESPIPPQASQADALAALGMGSPESLQKAGIPPSLATGGLDVDQLLKQYRNSVQPNTGELEPVRMVHRANPYADVPALYDLYVQAAASGKPAERFGLNVFQRGVAKNDLLPMDLPVGPEYVVGPGDGLAIDLWGGVSQRLMRTVDREGRVALPEAGPLLVAGRTLGDVQQEVQRILRTQFRDVSADVSLLRLRTVRVYVVGEVSAPGAYDVSSMSTPLNALFTAGGVTQRGSLRRLEHYRGNQLVEQVDAYDLLLHGVRGKLQRLESGDSLRVPPLGAVVTADGMVRRPAIYELKNEKNLEEVLDLAGGILPAAALRHIEVQRLVAHQQRTMFSLDLGESSNPDAVREQMRQFAVQDGDQIHIFPIAPYNTAAVYLEGHVLRPGRYSYQEGMKLTDLVTGYKDLLPEPSGRYAEIIRLKAPDYRPVVESFDLTKALENPDAAPKLEALDTVRIFGRYDFEGSPEILVTGEVRAPGRYGTSGQQHLRDVIYEAGGLSPDAWPESAQVFRQLTDGTTKVYSVNLRNALEGNATDNLLLEARDRVVIQRQPELAQPQTVYVQGEVANPGRYPLAAGMHTSDLIRSAGGLLRSASAQHGALLHYTAATTQAGKAATADESIDLDAALEGNTKDDLPLHAGDVLTVPLRMGWKDIGASVAVRGEVRHAGTYGIRPGERLSAVLERAGGFSPDAYPYGTVFTRREVRDLEMKSHAELVQRVKFEQISLKGLPENDQDQKNAKLTAMAQAQTTLEQLQANAPVGRMVIHIQIDIKEWRNTSADPVLRDGDSVLIPKRANYVMVTGQVFNPTSVAYRPGRSAKWYLSQAGGFTQLANKQAAFVVRADGSVIAAKNNSGFWAGNPMNTVLKPGDSIVVPERAPNVGGRNWTQVLQMAQIASSVALVAAYVVP